MNIFRERLPPVCPLSKACFIVQNAGHQRSNGFVRLVDVVCCRDAVVSKLGFSSSVLCKPGGSTSPASAITIKVQESLSCCIDAAL